MGRICFGDTVLHLAGIHLFPVKALRGQSHETAVVEPWGLAADRRYLVVDADGRFLTQRDSPALATLDVFMHEDGLRFEGAGLAPLRVTTPVATAPALTVSVWRDRVSAVLVDPRADAWLEAALGRPCRLVYMAAPATARPVDSAFGAPTDRVSFADGFPVLLTTTASLDALNAQLARPVGMDRFRSNLVIAGATAWAEDGWRHLRIGSILFEAVKPCERCIVTTTDQRTGIRDPAVEPIRTLQRFRRDPQGQVIFGQNLVPRSWGQVTVGDPVEILPSDTLRHSG